MLTVHLNYTSKSVDGKAKICDYRHLFIACLRDYRVQIFDE